MSTGALVTLIIISVAVAVVAAFLITVVYQLARIMGNLKTVLGVVGGVVEKTEALEPVISDIRADLAGGEAAIGSAVDRLKARTGYEEGAADHDRDREPAGIGTSSDVDPQSSGFRNY